MAAQVPLTCIAMGRVVHTGGLYSFVWQITSEPHAAEGLFQVVTYFSLLLLFLSLSRSQEIVSLKLKLAPTLVLPAILVCDRCSGATSPPAVPWNMWNMWNMDIWEFWCQNQNSGVNIQNFGVRTLFSWLFAKLPIIPQNFQSSGSEEHIFTKNSCSLRYSSQIYDSVDPQ